MTSQVKTKDPFLDPALFLKTLSYREFLSCAALAFVWQAVLLLYNYVSGVDAVDHYRSIILPTLFFSIAVCNHVFYKSEHKAGNNFVGRIMHDVIFLITVIAVLELNSLVFTRDYELFYDFYYVNFFTGLGFFIMVVLFECLVAFVRNVLPKFTRWLPF